MATMKFGELLRKERSRAGMSMGDLARKLGVSVPYVSDVERGNRAPFSTERTLHAAEAIGIDSNVLLVAASRDRGAFELQTKGVSSRAREVGAALARGWSDLTEEQLEQIARILGR